jgi:hypothetical protein
VIANVTEKPEKPLGQRSHIQREVARPSHQPHEYLESRQSGKITITENHVRTPSARPGKIAAENTFTKEDWQTSSSTQSTATGAKHHSPPNCGQPTTTSSLYPRVAAVRWPTVVALAGHAISENKLLYEIQLLGN